MDGDSVSKSFQVMGILNLNSDSFYPDSRVASVDQALETAQRFIADGADYLDLGAESSRPGSQAISEDQERARLIPALTEIRRSFQIPISVDTYKPAIAKAAMQAGANIINDITALQRHRDMASVIADHDGGVILMHMQGDPLSMQRNPHYDRLIEDIYEYLEHSIAIAEEAGIDPKKIMIDPGIGFGKTLHHNLELIAHLDRFLPLQKPILLGASRKSFIGNILGSMENEERLEGSLAAAVAAYSKGASVFRVHDVGPTVRALKVTSAIHKHRERKDS